MSLLGCYREALELTREQERAIAQDDWDHLPDLVERRGKCLEEAGALIPTASPTEKKEARVLLEEIRKLDTVNTKAILARKEALAGELSEMNHYDQALGGYQESFDAVSDSKFLNGSF